MALTVSLLLGQPYSVACIFAYSVTVILPIMLALCLMLSGTHYAQNYAGIIGWCLNMATIDDVEVRICSSEVFDDEAILVNQLVLHIQ